ncbi:MAG TPA: HlyD family efflux transporter periplasmic adaptor subunit [Bacteroidales bacterium]|nr:HlyD family efflux transporter periplasmic adaptor subunit [Bacteroidales bacterium]HQG62449.1 HlyD family efflux transporter periplasmic adaptor subunit [Bacteroidales bacterium]HQK69080.1 HlyD family efflux transporter periplasmic adaptor subunit [Bacteroidales bacterium]
MDRLIEKKKGLQKKHVIWIAGGALFLLLAGIMIFGDHSSAFRVERDKLTISAVESGIFNDYISVIGTVEPITTIYLDAIEGGRVTERLIEEGSMVKKGDVILKLENRQLYQTILNSEASLAEKENYLRNTKVSFEAAQIASRKDMLDSRYRMTRRKRTYEQNEILVKNKYVPVEEYIQSKEDYEYEVKLLEINKIKAVNDSLLRTTSMQTLEEDLVKMRQMYQLVRARMDDLDVKAPVDGQLGMLDAEVGQLLSAGQRVGQINVLTDFKVTARTDEYYIDRIVHGLKCSFDRSGTKYDLVVRKVLPEVRGGQFEIEMVFEGAKPDNIRTGQTYQMRLELGEAGNAVLIPRGGFFQSTGGQWVFVLNANGTEAVKRNIRFGRQNPQYYEVLEGLNTGEQVITSGYELFGNADRIIFK